MKNEPHGAASATRRTLLQGGAALTFAPWFLRDARAADVPRFALGVASGQPRADGMVLWTRLTGAGLPERATVQWEIARDAAVPDIGNRRFSRATSGRSSRSRRQNGERVVAYRGRTGRIPLHRGDDHFVLVNEEPVAVSQRLRLIRRQGAAR